jgi:hypothetical protein
MLTNSPREPVEHDRDRRWIADEYFDLIVWYEPDGAIHGFQLCYDKPGRERALTWTRERGFVHTAIDSGESRPTANRTPILVPDGVFPTEDVRREFLVRERRCPPRSASWC